MRLFNKRDAVETVKVNDITMMDNDITFLDYLDLKEDIERMLNDNDTDLEEIEISMRIMERKKKELLEIFAFRMNEDTKKIANEIKARCMSKDGE